jgi:hypothetical protein
MKKNVGTRLIRPPVMRGSSCTAAEAAARAQIVKYTVVDPDDDSVTYIHVGYDVENWNGPCIKCGGSTFSTTYDTNERTYQHFCSGECAMRFDSTRPQSVGARAACVDHVKQQDDKAK